MSNYKINLIYCDDVNINDTFIKVLKKELKDYMFMIDKEKQSINFKGKEKNA